MIYDFELNFTKTEVTHIDASKIGILANGTLIFEHDGEVIEAYAPGSWRSVHRHELRTED